MAKPKIASLGKLALLSLLIKLLLIPWFYHPDLKSQHFHFQYLSQGIVNIYSYLQENRLNLPNKDTFNYLPLTYFTFGFTHSLTRLVAPSDFTIWVNDWGPDQNKYPNLPIFILLLKIPYVIADFAIAYILFRISRSKILSLLWLFNPFVFYLIYILGNFDIVPAALVLLSYFLLTNNKYHLSALTLGISVAIKFYPLLFFPFFLLSLKSSYKNMIIYLLYFLIVPIVSTLPFLGDKYLLSSFIGSGLTQKLFQLTVFYIPLFPAVYIFLLVRYLINRQTLIKSLCFLFLLFVSTVSFHPQWLIWFLPFLFIWPNRQNQTSIIIFSFLTVLLVIFILLFDDQYLSWGHLIPLNLQFATLTTPYNFLRYRLYLNPQTIQNQIKVLLAAISLIIFLKNK